MRLHPGKTNTSQPTCPITSAFSRSELRLTHCCPLRMYRQRPETLAKLMRREPTPPPPRPFASTCLLNGNGNQSERTLQAWSLLCLCNPVPGSLLFTFQIRAPHHCFFFFGCIGSSLLAPGGLSLVAVSGGCSSLRCAGFSTCGTWASVLVARGL